MLGVVCSKLNMCMTKVYNYPPFLLLNLRTISLSASALTKCPPKRRVSRERRWRKKNNMSHYFKLVRSWHNIIPCDSCGNYHRKWIMCPTCYDQTRYETEMVRKVLKDNGEDLSEESVLKYRNDIKENVGSFQTTERVISIEGRDRPAGWFSESLWKKM